MSDKYFESQKFEGIEIDHETLSGYTFIDCAFHNCTLTDSRLVGCTFSECRFYGCSVSGVKSEESEIKFAEFTDCTLVGIDWADFMSGSRFADPIQKLTDCRLKYNNFVDMSFRKFDFSGSDYMGSMFAECVLSECSFNSCPLKDTEFFKCDLRKTDFRGTTGHRIDILSCKMKGSRFSYAEAAELLGVLEIKLE